MSGTFFVLAATMALAFKGIFASLVFQEGLGVAELVTLRFAISLPCFVIICLIGWKSRSHIKTKHIPGLAALSLLFLASTYADAYAVKYLGAGLSRMILFLFPLFIMIFDAVKDKEWPSKRRIIVFMTAYFGIGLMILGKGIEVITPEMVVGILCALSAAITYGSFLRLNQHMLKEVRPQAVNAQVALVATLFSLVFEGPSLNFAPLNQDALIYMFLLAILATVIPFWLMLEGMRRTGAATAALIAMIGPAITLTAAVVILDEEFVAIQMVGFGLIMLAMGYLQGRKAT